MADFATRQVRRQRGAFGLLFLGGCHRGGAELFNLLGDRRQVSVEFFVQQALLLRVKSFGLRRKFHALQERVLVFELVQQRCLVTQFAQQALGELAQLRCIQLGQGLLVHHHEPKCACAPGRWPLAHLPIANATLAERRFRPR